MSAETAKAEMDMSGEDVIQFIKSVDEYVGLSIHTSFDECEKKLLHLYKRSSYIINEIEYIKKGSQIIGEIRYLTEYYYRIIRRLVDVTNTEYDNMFIIKTIQKVNKIICELKTELSNINKTIYQNNLEFLQN